MAISAFLEVSIVILLALALSMLMKFLRQPLIIGYIITGIIVSPYILDLLESTSSLELFAHIGVAILLFMVGLGLNPKTIKEVGKVSAITGIGQIIFTSLFGFLIALGFGFEIVESIYIAVALTFSSTIIILKLLSDKGDLHTLYGKISVGFLIVQDLAVILIMMGLSAFQQGGPIGSVITVTILKGIGVLGVLYLVTKYFLPRIQNFIASSQELLLLFSTTWCFALASLFNYLNFSIEAGALLAGVTLSTNNFRLEIGSKLRPLRDFFIVIFFIVLGAQLTFGAIQELLIPAIAFSLFVLIGNPLIVMSLMGFLGYKKRTSFQAGLTVAQISEFSLIFVALGASIGHIQYSTLSFITIIALITIALSSYMIIHSEALFRYLSPLLRFFERSTILEKKRRSRLKSEVILFGCDHLGEKVLDSFRKKKKKITVVDYNPTVVNKVLKKKYSAVFGDASNIETLEELNFNSAKMVISTIDDDEINLFITEHIRETNKKAIILTVCRNPARAIELYEAGANFVLIPQHLGGGHISGLIERNGFSEENYIKEKLEHIKILKKKK